MCFKDYRAYVRMLKWRRDGALIKQRTLHGWCPPLFGGSLVPVPGEGTGGGSQRHGGVSGSRPPAVMGLRFRRLRRMSSGEDVVTPSSSSSGAQPHQQQPAHPPNNGSSEEEEACDGLAELSRPVRPLPIKDGYLHVLSGDHLWFRLYVALHAEKLDAYYELSDKVPVISVSLAGCEVVTPDKVTGSAPGEVCFPIQLVKKPINGEKSSGYAAAIVNIMLSEPKPLRQTSRSLSQLDSTRLAKNAQSSLA
ncbi:hypothetical protein HPB52_016405 [Rhipicephalus sanguineus]|uniref:Uncharacterized protein n=1 Tax=Rhipicephalus sanguineus TaxID=34632 RepID=A0A9D4SXM1_RHISA|nr:hypothetical protein HPB52_016405 [Rhipicephalus sanguineus]